MSTNRCDEPSSGKVEDLIRKLEEATDAGFKPTELQLLVKSRMLGLIVDNPIYSLDDLTLEGAIHLTKERRLSKWWNIDGFQDWFKNRNEFAQKNEHLIALAQDAMERILRSTNPKMAGAQVSAFKVLLEVGNKMPAKKTETKYSDESINRMDPLQLDDFLRKAGYAKITEMKPLALEGPVIDGEDRENG